MYNFGKIFNILGGVAGTRVHTVGVQGWEKCFPQVERYGNQANLGWILLVGERGIATLCTNIQTNHNGRHMNGFHPTVDLKSCIGFKF